MTTRSTAKPKRLRSRTSSKVKNKKNQGSFTKKAISLFSQLSEQNLDLIQDFYAPDAVFQDPFFRLQGSKAIQSYYLVFFRSVSDVQLEFPAKVESKNECFLLWKMKFRLKWLPLMQPFTFDGGSYFRFSTQSGKVEFHRDHIDLNQLVFENIPWIGRFIQRLRSQISDYISTKYQ